MRFSHLLAVLAGLTLTTALPPPHDSDDTTTAPTTNDTTPSSAPTHHKPISLSLHPPPSNTTSPAPATGDALICAPDVTPGPCTKVPASNTCVALPADVAGKVRTIYQNRGGYCEFFRTGDCRGRLGYGDASLGAIRTVVPLLVGDVLRGALCRLR